MASKDSNGLVISLSVFVLLTVGLGVAWYMTWSHSNDLTRDLAAAKKAESDAKGAINNLNQDLTSLKAAVGRPEPEVDDIVTNTKLEIARRAGNETSIRTSFINVPINSAARSRTTRAGSTRTCSPPSIPRANPNTCFTSADPRCALIAIAFR